MPLLTLCGLLVTVLCTTSPNYSVVVHNNTKCEFEARVLMSNSADSCALHATTNWKECAEHFSTAIDVQPPGRSSEGVGLYAVDIRCANHSERIYFDSSCGPTAIEIPHEDHVFKVYFTSKSRLKIE